MQGDLVLMSSVLHRLPALWPGRNQWLQPRDLWVSRIQSRSPVAGLSRCSTSPTRAGSKAVGIHLGQRGGLGMQVEKQPGPATGLLRGAAKTGVGGGGGPVSAKPHAAPEEPAFWIRQYPEKSAGGRSLGWQAG